MAQKLAQFLVALTLSNINRRPTTYETISLSESDETL